MEPKVNKKIGVKDIAARAGVSIGTVDRVLHNRGEVKEETRKRVLEIVDELGYSPNIIAKSLSSKKTTRIAIIIPDSSDNNPYWEKPIHGIKMAAEELEKYNTQILKVYFDASSEESFEKVLHDVCTEEPDGIVLNPVFKAISLKYIESFNEREIPYVFIDVNLKEVDNLGYFGQDAEQSGRVAASLMCSLLPDQSKVLIVKQANKKVFSQHIESRILGFTKFLGEESSDQNLLTQTVEIDLLDKNEPGATLSSVFSQDDFDGFFIPNSRAFKLLDYFEEKEMNKKEVIGYDLLDRNIRHMEKGKISYLISQKPEVQAYNAIFALFDYLVTKKVVNKTNYSPIDIIIRENLEYYKRS
jgi:LacI family transcriptional regulator